MREDKLVPTTDDWCPNINEKFVRLSFFNLDCCDTEYRVCVWGGDDLGMELDTSCKTKALGIHRTVSEMEDVTFEKLSDLGFVSA